MIRILHPERFQGHGQRPPYFEGWYYKLVDATERHRYAIIPGITLNPGSEGPHSFVQVLDGVTGATAYHVYPLADFHAAPDMFDVRIGPNRFTQRGLTLNLPSGDLALRAHTIFRKPQPWPVTLTAPGIMGWFGWLPWMECYHGVVSLDHAIIGEIAVGDAAIDFTGGRGYIEKDWGRSFPSAWVWMQSNHFRRPGTSLVASVARIPWLGHSFRGFIVGLLHRGTLYRFATYTGAKLEALDITPAAVQLTLTDRLYRLDITAHRPPPAATGALRGPNRTDMRTRVLESLSARISARLTARQSGAEIFAGEGRHAGLEVGGDLPALLRR